MEDEKRHRLKTSGGYANSLIPETFSHSLDRFAKLASFPESDIQVTE